MRTARLPAVVLMGALLAAACGCASGDAAPAAEHPYFAGLAAPPPWVIAHRGGMGLWPENTRYAFERAARAGADVLDLDVRTSADGALVVVHDAELGRTTEASGRVDALTLRELQSLDAGYRWSSDGGATHPFRGQGIRIPALDEVFRSFPGAHLGLEIKESDPTAPGRVCQAIRGAQMQERVLVASFHAAATQAFRAACPEVASGAVFSEALRFRVLSALGLTPTRPPAEALLVPLRFAGLPVPTAHLVRTAHALKLHVEAWLANEPAEMERLLEAGVDGIMTDYPDRLSELVRRHGATH